jgi:hypothetical protein
MHVGTEAVLNIETPTKPDGQKTSDPLWVMPEQGVHCPICLLHTGRLIRNKVYCGNCGFIES